MIGAVVRTWNYLMNLLKAHKASQEIEMRPGRGSEPSEASSESRLASKNDPTMSLIRHLQKMLAYQQLSMERYNDAASFASGSPSSSGMAVGNVPFNVQNRTLVSQHVIPALEYKIELIRSMKDQHEQAGQLVTEEIRQPYDEMSAAINVMLERANLQYSGFSSWVQNPDSDVDVTRLDQDEFDLISDLSVPRTRSHPVRTRVVPGPDVDVSAVDHETRNRPAGPSLPPTPER